MCDVEMHYECILYVQDNYRLCYMFHIMFVFVFIPVVSLCLHVFYVDIFLTYFNHADYEASAV